MKLNLDLQLVLNLIGKLEQDLVYMYCGIIGSDQNYSIDPEELCCHLL